MLKKKLQIGPHVSISGGLEKAIERGVKIDATAIQIFTKNNRSYFASALEKQNIDRFKDAQKKTLMLVVVHASYLINIGSNKPEVESKSVKALLHELERCEQLGIAYLVLHPGAHTGAGVEECVARIAQNLDAVIEKFSGKTMVLLETAAGQGTTVGRSFEELKTILDLTKNKNRVGICFDTCHVFAAGYNINTPDNYKKTWKEFETHLGYESLKLIHLNDSKMPCGALRDRHENLGKGEISMATFERIMSDENLKGVPKILETPDEDLYEEEIRILRDFGK